MEIRDLRPSDATAIREIARESMTASYRDVDESAIDAVVDRWYDEQTVEELLSEENVIFVVASNEDMHGYAQGEVLMGETVIGDIHWLHVRPAARGEGYGTQLLGDITDRMEKNGVTLLRGRVLDVNRDGPRFYEAHGFEQSLSRTIDVEGTDHEELVYEKRLDDGEDVLDRIAGPAERELYVDYTEGETGTLAPLYPTYFDESKEEQYGWLCRNCGSTSTAMDPAGRIQCSECDNTRKATRWDGAYL